MDNKELKSSSRILVQVGTAARPSGWKTRPTEVGKKAGEDIVSYGKAPWQITRGRVAISLTNPTVQTAHVLDVNGMSVATIGLEQANGVKQFRFPEDALYVVLK